MSTMTLDRAIHHPAGPVRPVGPTRPVRPARPGSLRLTRRGRVVVFALALALVLGVGLALASGSVATDEAGTPEPTRVVMVDAGDTLWDIAADLAADGDTRAMVDRIQRLNALEGGMVAAGQRLRVPVD